MKPLTLVTASLLALSLAACGGAEDTAPPATSEADMPMDMASDGDMDHGDHDMAGMGDGVGHATGTIRSVGSQGDFLTIEHGPFDGDIAMGAMTMGFDIMGDVDLSGFADGDEVTFMVKQGRDGAYRIMAICNTAADGDDCLDGLMDHAR
ncbi:MAG: copper-binding protein [Pseudomonadota bacterium]